MGRGQRPGLILVAIAVAVVAFVALRPDDEDEGSKSQKTETRETRPQETTAGEPAPKPSFETIVVAGGKPKGGVKKITLSKGDTARIQVESDEAGEVHLHGYDLMRDVGAGGSVRFRFKADIEGVFEIELEETKTPIAELVVEP